MAKVTGIGGVFFKSKGDPNGTGGLVSEARGDAPGVLAGAYRWGLLRRRPTTVCICELLTIFQDKYMIVHSAESGQSGGGHSPAALATGNARPDAPPLALRVSDLF